MVQPSGILSSSEEAEQPVYQDEHGHNHEYSDIGACFEDVSDKLAA